MEWTEETIERLRGLWAEGHSTAEIGRRMGISKNAVVGKAHRLNLSARPSPIRRDGPGSPARAPVARRITGSTLPPLAAAAEPVVRAAPAAILAAAAVIASGPAAPRPVMREPVAAVKPPPPLRAITPRIGRSSACCWPIGEPGTKSFRFCDAAAAGGKPYCYEHAQIAYVRVRDRREDAA